MATEEPVPPTYDSLSGAQMAFVNEYSRRLLALGWAIYEMETGEPAPDLVAEEKSVYAEHALKKGWVSKRNGRLLAGGWKTAAAFLKR